MFVYSEVSVAHLYTGKKQFVQHTAIGLRYFNYSINCKKIETCRLSLFDLFLLLLLFLTLGRHIPEGFKKK